MALLVVKPVFVQRPKLLGFYMPSPSPHPYVPNRGKMKGRKEIYYTAWDILWEETK
jgi:hypothetical protein